MNENKDYVSHLNKARKKRNQKWDPRYLLLAIVVVLLIGLGVLAAVNVKSAVSGKAARKSDNVIEEPGTGLEAASASNAAREEEEKAKEEQEIQSAIEPYYNVLFTANPASIGGEMPGSDFYYVSAASNNG